MTTAPLIFFLCHLWMDPVQRYAVRTMEECAQLEMIKGAKASFADRYVYNSPYSMLRFETICGQYPYHQCPVYRSR